MTWVEQEATDKDSEALRLKLSEQRQKRELKERFNKHSANNNDDDDDDPASWVRKQRHNCTLNLN